MASISPKCWLMPALPVWPYGPSVQLAAPATHKNALSLVVWAKTVGISNTATQFISNLFNPVYTRLHCSVTNSSNELNCSSGWKKNWHAFKPHHAPGQKAKHNFLTFSSILSSSMIQNITVRYFFCVISSMQYWSPYWGLTGKKYFPLKREGRKGLETTEIPGSCHVFL